MPSPAFSRIVLLALALSGVSIAADVTPPTAEELHDAADKGDLAAVTDLVSRGAPVNVGTGEYNFTPLIAAAESSCDVLKYLIAHGADVNLADKQGSTPLLHSTNADKADCALALLKAGADPSKDSHYNRTPLMYSANKGNDTIVAALIAAKADLETTCDVGTALTWAACANHVNATEMLLKAGAKIDRQDNSGKTALHKAVHNGCPDTVALLIQYHAAFDIKDKAGVTPLVQACIDHRRGIEIMLVNAGEDVNATDSRGFAPINFAANVGDTELTKLLESKGAQPAGNHIMPSKDPDRPLSPVHAWALALGAPYTQRFNESHKVLGGGATDVEGTKLMLSRDWNITDQKSLLKELDDLQHHGHHEAYFNEGQRLDAMAPGAYIDLLAAHTDRKWQIEAMKASYEKWKDKTGLAWDLCRASMLINQGYVAHFVNERAAWTLIMPIAQQAQQNFSSWQEFSDNFLDGRKIWDVRQNPQMAACVKLLADPKEPNSPWNYLPWNTDLTVP